jgi:DNA (cytosine-5)-methyltransferase 1
MKHGSLFSGIGGFDLAAQWMGWENTFHCEWMDFPRKVLEYYWPEADSYIDITKTNFKKHEGKVDIITGGFPCQPFSMAGKRKGSSDERYLWDEMLRAIQEVKPKYVIAENVYGLTNIEGGLVFEKVWSDLEVAGYEVQSFVIPSAGKNAPHKRDRIWIVAYRSGLRFDTGRSEQPLSGNRTNGEEGDAPYTNSGGLERTTKVRRNSINVEWKSEFRTASDTISERRDENDRKGKSKQSNEVGTKKNATNTTSIRRTDALEDGELGRERSRFGNQRPTWDTFPSESPICGRNDGLPRRLDGITFSKWRNESIKGYGNAITPPVAYELFKVIEEIDRKL